MLLFREGRGAFTVFLETLFGNVSIFSTLVFYHIPRTYLQWNTLFEICSVFITASCLCHIHLFLFLLLYVLLVLS